MPSVDGLTFFSVVAALMDLWCWMLGWLLVGALGQVTFPMLLKHVRQPYRAGLMTIIAMAIFWLAVVFWLRSVQYATTGVMTMHIYIERASPTACLTLGALAALIGAMLIFAIRKLHRPVATAPAC